LNGLYFKADFIFIFSFKYQTQNLKYTQSFN